MFDVLAAAATSLWEAAARPSAVVDSGVDAGPSYVPEAAGEAATPWTGYVDGPACDPLFPFTCDEGEPSLEPPAPRRRTGESVDVSATDDRDMFGKQTALLQSGEVTGFTKLDEMVDLALAAAGDQPLGRLGVHDHANSGLQQIGDDALGPEALEIPAVRESLARLAEAFGPDGALELHGCHVGSGERGDLLLRGLARELNVPVSGGLPFQNALPGFEGSVKTCYPPVLEDDGRYYQTCETVEHPVVDATLESLYSLDFWY